jgi:VWFA-related protein
MEGGDVRNLSVSIAILICWLCLIGAAGLAQEKPSDAPAVFIVAVKGECLSDRPFAIINGQARVLPGRVNSRTASGKTVLMRFADDPAIRKTVEKEFKKSRAFRVVDSLDQADLVFHVCSSYLEQLFPNRFPRRNPFPSDSRLASQAAVVSVEALKLHVSAYQELLRAAIWEADTLTPEKVRKQQEKEKAQRTRKDEEENDRMNIPQRGDRIVFSTTAVLAGESSSPNDLVKLFLKEAPSLADKLAALPKPQPAARSVVAGASPPAPAALPPNAAARVNEDTPLRIETTLVLVPVSVMDRDGKFAPGLTAKDFQVFEDGAQQEITDFGSADNPLHIALMLDVSGSTQFKIEDIQEAALTFVDQMRPQDQVMVVSFDSRVMVDAEFTNDRERLKIAIMRTRTGGGTRFYDALDLTLTERLNKIQGRKAIVLFTDGVDTVSRLAGWKEIIARFEEAGVLVYPVRYDTWSDMRANFSLASPPGVTRSLPGSTKEEYEAAAKRLKELATRTGARYYEVENIGDTKQAFASIAEELRRQYWLGYYPTNTTRDGRYRKIRVTVNKPEVAVRARDGYRTTAGEGRQ